MKVFLSVVGVLLVGVGILLWSLIPDRRIAGKWGEPEVSILEVRGHRLEDGRGMVLIQPLESLDTTSQEIESALQSLKARLREKYLQVPDSKNRYDSISRPKR